MQHRFKHATRCLSGKQTLAEECLYDCLHSNRASHRHFAAAVAQTQLFEGPVGCVQLPQQQQPTSVQQQRQQQYCARLAAQVQQPDHSSLQQLSAGLHHHQLQPVTQQQHYYYEWPGVKTWRARGVDYRRQWGSDNKPTADTPEPAAAATKNLPLPSSLVGVALQVLNTPDPDLKSALTHRGWKAYSAGHIPLQDQHQQSSEEQASFSTVDDSCVNQQQQQQQRQYQRPPDRPARPDTPQLVVPKHVPSPKDSPLPLNAHMLHNLAHIELNAIDLAWDTVARYSHLQLPPAFYEDFARVADDESRHFAWCVQRLAELGHRYGDMPAHDLLWQGAQSSAGDLGARLAIVPMSQEARGLDAGKRLAQRLVGAGDARSAAIVTAIATEERAHVAVGVVWFTRMCGAMGIDPPSSFRSWLTALGPELLKGPFNHQERQLVGLQRDWYDMAAWPPQQLQQVVKPALAAAARGKGLSTATAEVDRQAQLPGSSDEGAPTCAATVALMPVVPQEGRQLEELRLRLWQMLEMEGSASCN